MYGDKNKSKKTKKKHYKPIPVELENEESWKLIEKKYGTVNFRITAALDAVAKIAAVHKDILNWTKYDIESAQNEL